jgi:hypothetical protein
MPGDDTRDARSPVEVIDMSPEAIDRRLRDLGQMVELGRELAKVEYVGKVRDLQQERPGPAPSAHSRSREPSR